MGEFYTWNAAELGLGVNEMDKEHQELIARMNVLYKAFEENAPFSTMEKHVEELASYTIKHFSDEEAYMQKIGYAALATHKIIHQQLLTQFTTFTDEFKKTQKISPSFFNFLKVWLNSHIKGIDMKYADKVRNTKSA